MKKLLLVFGFFLAFATSAYAGTISPTGVNQGDLVKLLSNIEQHLGFHIASSPNLMIGSVNTANIGFTTTVSYVSAGDWYDLAISTDIPVSNNVAIFPNIATQNISTVRYYLLSLNSARNGFAIHAGIEKTLTRDTELPIVPTSNVPIGWFSVYTASANFVLGRNGLDSSDYGVFYHNFGIPKTGPSKIDMDDL